jgi:hypothetical protein
VFVATEAAANTNCWFKMWVLTLVTQGATGCAVLPDRMISTSSLLFGLVSGKLKHELALGAAKFAR